MVFSVPVNLIVLYIDELVKTMCLAWASPLSAHPKYTADSYDKNVLRAVVEGNSEVAAIQNWMNAVHESNRKQKELKAV